MAAAYEGACAAVKVNATPASSEKARRLGLGLGGSRNLERTGTFMAEPLLLICGKDARYERLFLDGYSAGL